MNRNITNTPFLDQELVYVLISNDEEEYNEGRLSGAGGPIIFVVKNCIKHLTEHTI